MKTYNYKTFLRKEPEGGFTVFVPALEGCITYGKTLEKAQQNAKEAVKLYLESLAEDTIEFPTETELLEYNLQVTLGSHLICYK